MEEFIIWEILAAFQFAEQECVCMAHQRLEFKGQVSMNREEKMKKVGLNEYFFIGLLQWQ